MRRLPILLALLGLLPLTGSAGVIVLGINGATTDTLPRLQELGVGAVRFDNLKWNFVMDRADRVAFDGSVAPWHVRHDEIIRAYRQQGLEVLPYVFQTPEWATTAPPQRTRNRQSWPPRRPQDYGEAMYQIAARYGSRPVDPGTLLSADKRSGLGWIRHYQLWNEPDLRGPDWAPWVGDWPTFFAMMREGAEGVRRADPTALVVAPGLAGIHADVFEPFRTHTYADGLRALDLVDILAVHFYSGRQDPEIATDDPNANRKDTPDPNRTPFPQRLAELMA